MGGYFERWLNSHWYRKPGILAYILWPLSCVFQCVAMIRRFILSSRAYRASCPVVIVGNISVGGTGKTPLLIHLANTLKTRGFKVGIVSRGYGVAHKIPYRLQAADSAHVVGDEAKEIFDRTGLPIVVCANRRLAVQSLEHECDVILSDDGLQHYRLARDIEIAVVDGLRLFGNGFCLPAGPLRESPHRLRTVDFVVCNEGNLPGAYQMNTVALGFHSVANADQEMSLAEAQQKTWTVVTGIANPDKFLQTLSRLKIRQNNVVIFPDHFNFSVKNIDLAPGQCVIMTHKDAVKCQTFADNRHWYLDITVSVDDSLIEKLVSRIKRSRQP